MNPPSLRCSRRSTREARRSASVDRWFGSSARFDKAAADTSLEVASWRGLLAGAAASVQATPPTSMAEALRFVTAVGHDRGRVSGKVTGHREDDGQLQLAPLITRREPHKGVMRGGYLARAGRRVNISRTGLGVTELLLKRVLADHLRVHVKQAGALWCRRCRREGAAGMEGIVL